LLVEYLMCRNSSTVEALIEDFPYELHQVCGPENQLIWIERGVNPDNIFGDKRRSDWPFSQITADLICQKVAEGSSLSQVCREPGFPTYNILCRWRREHPDFNQDLKQAYEDRSEFFREKALEVIKELDSGGDIAAIRMKLDVLRWSSESDQRKGHKKS